MNKQLEELEEIIDTKVNKLKSLAMYIWENKEKIIATQKEALSGQGSTFYNRPKHYLPEELCSFLNIEIKASIHDILVVAALDGKLTKRMLIGSLFDVGGGPTG